MSIGVSKGIEKIELSPGETYSGDFNIINLNQTDSVPFIIKISPFSVNDGSYDANFSDYDDFNQIVDWTTLEFSSGELEPGEKRVVPYEISVPENAPAGGQYLSFLVEVAETDAEAKNLTLSTKSQVASLLYASVSVFIKKAISFKLLYGIFSLFSSEQHRIAWQIHMN